MAERAAKTDASGGAGAGGGPEATGAAEGTEAADLREEVERLRGILIERDQELGRVRGRLAEIDDHPLRYAALILRRHLSRATAERLLVSLVHRLRRRRG